jgi:hypothetical protein
MTPEQPMLTKTISCASPPSGRRKEDARGREARQEIGDPRRSLACHEARPQSIQP